MQLREDETVLLRTERSALTKWVAPPEIVEECGKWVLSHLDLLETEPPIMMRGREMRQRRCVGFFSDEVPEFHYSGAIQRACRIPLRETPMKMMLDEINSRFGSSYNALLVNVYRSGADYIGAHSDNERIVRNESTGVVAYQYGATRTLKITRVESRRRPRDEGLSEVTEKWKFSTPLEQVYGYRMVGDFQAEFKHEVPPEKRLGTVNGGEVRVSFTARRHVIPTAAAKVRID